MDVESFAQITNLAALIAGVAVATVLGWVFTTWLRVRHGYPLHGVWGQEVYPKTSSAELERIKLLSQENAQLRAEVGSVKDRLANVERIVTDGGYSLNQQIEALRLDGGDRRSQ